MTQVILIPDKEKNINRILIEFDGGGRSEKTKKSWKTRFTDGKWVEVPADGEHARICNEIFNASGYSTRRR